MGPTACFFTICGGGEDYDFLLGSIEHHAKMGRHVVLDTTPPGVAKSFKGLPGSVVWVHEPIYGAGWKEFKFRSALVRALGIAQEQGTDVVAQLDCDEYFSEDSPEKLFPTATYALVSVETIHWMRDGMPYSFGRSEFHARLWPAKMPVTWPVNSAWLASPHYNGNPDHHAIVRAPEGAHHVKVDGHFHYHLHYAVGEKSLDEETARTTIRGWPHGAPARMEPTPLPIWRWRRRGIKPSEGFQVEPKG